MRLIDCASFQKYGNIRSEEVESSRKRNKLHVIQTLEDTTKQNVVSDCFCEIALNGAGAVVITVHWFFQIRVVTQEVRFNASLLDELYNLFKVSVYMVN